ncbi:MAG: hemin ABC transporter permease [Rhodothermaceae bacterium]|nr:MAG: hemin ABC transporter permease [Rhodothermaceae bacterium]
MRKTPILLAGLAALTCASMVVAVSFGSEPISLRDIAHVVRYRLLGGAAPDPVVDQIVWFLRMPRVLLAMIVGGGLAVIGVAMQALVRNPLAEPYILGISSGASAGASLFYLGLLPPLISRTLTMPLAAFLGGWLSLSVVYLVARTNGRLSVARLLLAGVAMSALMASITSFVTLVSPDPNRLRAVLFWLLGSLNGTHWAHVPLPAVASLGGLVTMMALARPLDALLTGEEPARSLGVPVETVKRLLILLAALVTGTLVAFSGAIGFVGLIVPHTVRALVGVAHRRVIPASFMAGALFLLWADLGARALLPSQDFPVGIITALAGVPFFLILLRRSTYRFG